MEENNVKVKNKAKITIVVLIAFLLLGAASATILFMLKGVGNPANGEVVIKYSEKEKATDQATLQKLLAHESNMIIEVTDDIMINQPMTVKGGKKLTGDGTISMALYVKPYQYMFVVDQDSKLELDGVTIDGNGSSNCVKVEKDAQCSLLSGKLTYGCPTVIESFGDVYIKGGAIVDAIGTGVYVHSTGKVYMTAGSVRGCVDCGIEGAVDSYISVSEKAVIHDNMEYFIYSKGTCDITGGELRDAQSDMVYTSGVMNVKYEGKKKGDMLKWHDIKGCAFIVGNGGELNVDNLHVTDVENRIVSTAAGQNIAKFSNCLFENTGGDAVYVRTEVHLTNVEIKNAGLSGIMLIQTGKAHVENVTVTGTKKDGIQCGGGVVTGRNFTANSVGRIGVNSYKLHDVAASVTLRDVTVNGAKSNGLHVETSTLTVMGAKLNDVTGDGARAQKAGKLNITNIEIKNAKGRNIASYDEGSRVVVKNAKTVAGQRGIGAFGGDVTATKVSIDSPTEFGVSASKKSNVKITDVTIKNSAKTAVNANDATITIDKATIENPKETAGLNADYAGKITLKNADIKFAKNTKGDIDGVRAVSPATITLEKVDITNAPRHGVYADGKQAKIVAKNVTSTDCKRGVQIYKGGQVEGETVTIKSPAEYGVTCGDAGSKFTLKNLTVMNSGTIAVNVYDGAIGTVTNGTLKKSGAEAGFVGNKAQLTLNNVNVSDTAKSGVLNSGATLTVKGGSMKDAGEHGVFTYGEGQTTLTDFNVQDSTNQNIRVNDVNSKCVLDNVSTLGGERGIQIYSGGTVEGADVTIASPTVYGIACGDENSNLQITGLTVSGVKKHAVNVYGKAKATITDGTITDTSVNSVNVEAAEVTLNNVDISYDANVKGAYEGVKAYSGAIVTLNDVDIENAPEYGIQIWQGSNVTGSSVSIMSPGASGIICGDAGSKFDITDLYISDSSLHGVDLYTSGSGIITDGMIENAGEKGIQAKGSSSIELTDVIINDSTKENLYLHNTSRATINGMLMTQGGTYSLAIYGGSTVTKGAQGGDVIMSSPKTHGARIYDNGSKLDVDTLEIDNSKDDAVVVCGAQVTANDVTLTKCQQDGFYIFNGSTVTLKGTVDIVSPKSRGIRNDNGTINAGDATINITSSGDIGISVATGKVTIGTANITGAKGYSAVNVTDSGEITINGGTIKDSMKHGANANKTSKMNLKNCVIQNSGCINDGKTYYDIQNESGKATITLTNVTYTSKK